MTRETIFVCAGGTGGHVFPGLAVADALGRLAEVDCRFLGTARGMETRVVPSRGYPLELLNVTAMKGGGLRRAAKGALSVVGSMRAVTALFRRHSPKLVVSVGGYSAGPAALAALAARVPLAIVEPNAVPGFTHRLLGPFARRAYVAWDEVAERFPEGRARVFGVPLGRAFAPSTYHTRERRRVLVLGGSLGAQALNERVPLALGKVHRDLGGVEVVHQTGTGREAEVRGLYDRAGVAGARCVPFLDDVAGELADADLVVARAGAVTVAELACVGRASLLVPFPYAADDHQLKNATLYQRRGACRVVEQERATVDRLAADIRLVLSDDGLRERMARAAAKAGRPDAALEIACDLVELGGLKMRNVAGDDLRGSRGRRTEVH